MRVVVKSILYLSFVVICVSCGTSVEKTTQEVIVKVSQVQRQRSDVKKEFQFIAKPFRTSELSFRVGGPIDQFDLYAGSSYKKGEVIAEIDSRDFRIRRERTEAVYNQAAAEFERIKVLYDKENISASVYERAKADYTAAKTNFESATNELSDTKLLAPFNGHIEEVYIEKYQEVRAGVPVVSLVDIDQLRIELYISQDIALYFQSIKEISLSFDALPTQIYQAKVVEISKSTTKNNLSYLLTALLPNKEGKLLAGMSGKVFFDVEFAQSSSMVVVPIGALCHTPSNGDYVWITDTQTEVVSQRKVTKGTLQPNGMVSIVEGVSEGETVAISNLRFLSDGMNVLIHK